MDDLFSVYNKGTQTTQEFLRVYYPTSKKYYLEFVTVLHLHRSIPPPPPPLLLSLLRPRLYSWAGPVHHSTRLCPSPPAPYFNRACSGSLAAGRWWLFLHRHHSTRLCPSPSAPHVPTSAPPIQAHWLMGHSPRSPKDLWWLAICHRASVL